ncbi:MAG: hypothetical protein WKF48_11120 [Solirubrobacteraceae bacterium]
MEHHAARDDAVLPATRVTALVVVAVLLPALVILWGLPSRTDDLWAWTIAAPLTPIFMGAGYGAGAYFFVRVSRTRHWHEVSVGVLSAAVFALLMLVTTPGRALRGDRRATYAYIAGLAGGAAALLALSRRMEGLAQAGSR